MFIVIAFVQQQRLADALSRAWWMALLAFVIGALTVALPRQLPLVASFVAILVFEGLSLYTPFDAIALLCLVLGGFCFGLGVRSVIYQRSRRNSPRSAEQRGASSRR